MLWRFGAKLNFGGFGWGGIRVPGGIPRLGLEGSGPGGIKSGLDQRAKREQDGGVQGLFAYLLRRTTYLLWNKGSWVPVVLMGKNAAGNVSFDNY